MAFLGRWRLWTSFLLTQALELPPRFTLDLRKPAHTRWDGAVDLILSKHPYEESFLPVFQEHNKSLFDQLNASHFDALGKAVSSHYPETALELQGIAQQFAARGFPVTFEYLSAWLYFHELAHSDVVQKLDARECTGIVAETADGSIMQLANMDQSPLAARNLTLRISVVDDKGEPLFEGVDWYTLLSTGVSRAVKRGVASVQENWRSTDPVRKLDAIMADIQSGVISQMLVFRRAFETPSISSFEDFVDNVTHTRLAAPFYIVAAGSKPKQGVAIARNLTTSEKTDWFPSDDFYLCQCNTDRWRPDDPEDPRRTAAEALLGRLGREEATAMGLFAVVSAYPVHNPHTAYTAVMSAATGELHAYVREASCPVDPYASVVLDRRYCLKKDPGVLISI
ncbi:unnamed protein product [Durusdinium trenchii]|uniref:ceramidase n=1 Tax=Durusdinium trenchii TaxID=1381693 RepID=A0ABP0MS71_9DINO